MSDADYVLLALIGIGLAWHFLPTIDDRARQEIRDLQQRVHRLERK